MILNSSKPVLMMGGMGEEERMPLIKVNEIVVSDERMRKEFLNIDKLAESIKEFGLLQPLVVDREKKLIAGERRLKAITLLGWEEVEVVVKDEIEDWRKAAMEAEENLQRENLTWQEEVNGKLYIHTLYQKCHGESVQGKKDHGWTIDDTAELLGESHGSTAMDIQLAKAVQTNPQLLKKETKAQAMKALKMEKEREIFRAIADISDVISQSKGEEDISIICGDSREELKLFEEESFDFCVTDPPYGIDLQSLQDTFGSREARTGVLFDDNVKVIDDVIKPVMAEVYRILKPASHCYVFFAIARYTEIKQVLEEVGFWVCPTPLFWIKNNALNLRPWIIYPVNYEPIFYCAKGYPPRNFNQHQTKSTFDHPIMTGKTHPTEKPIPVVEWLVGNCSVEKERGIDPFLGSGTFTSVLKKMGRKGVGVEMDKAWAVQAKIRLETGKEEENDKDTTPVCEEGS